MKKFIKQFLFLSLFSTLMYYSCTSESPTSSGNSCDQVCKDQHVGYGITYLVNSIWEQNLYNMYGNVDTTVYGPKGGTAHIVGTIEYYYPYTANLTFDLLDCKDSNAYFSLTLTGPLHATGDFSSYDKQITLTSVSELAYKGTVGVNVNASVNDTCQISINASQYSVTGTICERNFSYYNNEQF
jgi:hypothetical protein